MSTTPPMSPPISVRLPIRNADADAPATTATSGKRTDEEMALPPRESEKNPTASELLGIANTAPENQAQPKIEISSSERPPPPSEAAVAEHQQRNPKSSQEDQNDNDERSEILANPREPLKPFDWADLEERYHQAMGERKHAEEQIYEEFNSLFSVFSEWSQTVTIYEQDRSLKRLRTRMGYVEQAEQSLEEKREHYIKVVKAFESALALLSSS